MKSYLRVKIKSLAEEARIIRLEERRTLGRRRYIQDHQGKPERVGELTGEFEGLHRHRVIDVRDECRVAQLAYAIIRNRPYARVEPSGSRKPNSRRVAELVTRYGYMKKDAAQSAVDAWLGIEPDPVASSPPPTPVKKPLLGRIFSRST